MVVDVTMEEVEEMTTLVVKETVKWEDISAAMPRAFEEIFHHMMDKGIEPLGPPFALYHSWEGGEADMECGVIVPGEVEVSGRLSMSVIPGGRMATAMHVGPYEELERTYNGIIGWMRENGHEPGDWMWEQYLTDPQEERDPSKWMTRVYWPIEGSR